MKRKTTKSKAASSVKDLPVKTVNARRGKRVKGGDKRRASHSEFSVTKLVDASTPKLYEN